MADVHGVWAAGRHRPSEQTNGQSHRLVEACFRGHDPITHGATCLLRVTLTQDDYLPGYAWPCWAMTRQGAEGDC